MAADGNFASLQPYDELRVDGCVVTRYALPWIPELLLVDFSEH